MDASALGKDGLSYLWSKLKVMLAGKEPQIKKATISFTAAGWAERDGAYEQTVMVTGGTASSLIALQPATAQISALQESGVTALVVDNDSGTFIAKAIGAAPSEDMTIQATITEVSA